jgi:uncharacterized damage-inducible protein DinB
MHPITRSAPVTAALIVLLATPAAAQSVADAVSEGLSRRFDTVSGHVMRAAEIVPEERYSYRPTEEVRTMGELFLHVAGAQFAYCAAVSGQPIPASARGEAAGKSAIVARVSASRDFCLAAYGGTTGDALGATIDVMGSQDTRAGVLIQNVGHSNLHYGNIVTYMRAIGLVPPSSE